MTTFGPQHLKSATDQPQFKYSHNFQGQTPRELSASAAKLGFDILQIAETVDLKLTVIHLRHRKTGMLMISTHGDDNHNFFEIRVPTLAKDSSGLAHIIEHCVLAGSRNFPHQDAFSNLRRSLILTSSNGTTSIDCTTYHASSTHLDSLRKMAEFLLDSVFHCLLTEEAFRRECGHVTKKLVNGAEVYDFEGVVFSEMRGQFASPRYSRVLARNSILGPDLPYRHSAGGSPAEIPLVTYENFLARYREWYSRTDNMVTSFYGNMPFEDRLALLAEALTDVAPPQAIPVRGSPEVLPPGRYEVSYLAPPGQNLSRQYFTEIHWTGPNVFDRQRLFELHILTKIVSSDEDSPLPQALIRNGLLGNCIGLDFKKIGDGIRLSISIPDTSIEDEAKIRAIIIGTLNDLHMNGVPATILDAVLSAERIGELHFGMSPWRGEGILARAANRAQRGAIDVDTDPFEVRVARLRADMEAGHRPLERLIGELLLNNPNRFDLLLVPSPDLEVSLRKEMRQAIQRAALTNASGAGQERSSSANSVAVPKIQKPYEELTLPNVNVINEVQTTTITRHGATVYNHTVSAMGPLVEIIVRVPTVWLGAEEQALLYTIMQLVLDRGPINYERGVFSAKMKGFDSKVSVGFVNYAHHHDTALSASSTRKELQLRFCCRANDLPEVCDLLSKTFQNPAFPSESELLNELDTWVSRSHRLTQGPQKIAACTAKRLLAAQSYLGAAAFIHSAEADVESFARLFADGQHDIKSLMQRTALLFHSAFDTNGIVVSATSSVDSWETANDVVIRFSDSLPGNRDTLRIARKQDLLTRNTAKIIPGDVNYIGFAAPLPPMSPSADGVTFVIAGLLRTFIDHHARTLGKAYGTYASISRIHGAFTFGSEQDPNALKTLQAIQDAPAFLRNDVTEADLRNAKIGVLSSFLQPKSPQAEGATALDNILDGFTTQDILEQRRTAAAVTMADVRRYADILEAALNSPDRHVVVYGTRAAIDEAIAGGVNLSVIN